MGNGLLNFESEREEKERARSASVRPSRLAANERAFTRILQMEVLTLRIEFSQSGSRGRSGGVNHAQRAKCTEEHAHMSSGFLHHREFVIAAGLASRLRGTTVRGRAARLLIKG